MLASLSYIGQRTQRCAALVAHSGVNRVLPCHLLGYPFSRKRQLPLEYASVSALRWENGRWSVQEILRLTAESAKEV